MRMWPNRGKRGHGTACKWWQISIWTDPRHSRHVLNATSSSSSAWVLTISKRRIIASSSSEESWRAGCFWSSCHTVPLIFGFGMRFQNSFLRGLSGTASSVGLDPASTPRGLRGGGGGGLGGGILDSMKVGAQTVADLRSQSTHHDGRLLNHWWSGID